MPFKGSRTKGDRIIRIMPGRGVDFSKPSTDLADDMLSQCINFEYDLDRGGLNKLSTTPGLDVVTYNVGMSTVKPLSLAKYGDYIVIGGDDGNLYYVTPSTTAGSSFTLIGALTGSERPQFTQFNDKLIIASGGQLQSWDGTTLTTISTSPNAKFVGRNAYDNRLIAAGDSSNPSRVWWSGVGDETQWDPTASTNPALYEDVRWADGSEIKAIAVIYNDVIVFKGDNPKSITRLTPVDATTYEHRLLALDKGVVTDSVLVVKDEVYFLDTEGLNRITSVNKYGDLAFDPDIGKRVGSYLNDCGPSAFLWFNPKKAQIWINPGNDVYIVVYHLLNDAFVIFNLNYPVTACLYDPVTDYNFLAVHAIPAGLPTVEDLRNYRIVKWLPDYNLQSTFSTKEFTGSYPFMPTLFKGYSFRWQAYGSTAGTVEFAHKTFNFSADSGNDLTVLDTTVSVTDTTYEVIDSSEGSTHKRYNRKLDRAYFKMTVTGNITISDIQIYLSEGG